MYGTCGKGGQLKKCKEVAGKFKEFQFLPITVHNIAGNIFQWSFLRQCCYLEFINTVIIRSDVSPIRHIPWVSLDQFLLYLANQFMDREKKTISSNV